MLVLLLVIVVLSSPSLSRKRPSQSEVHSELFNEKNNASTTRFMWSLATIVLQARYTQVAIFGQRNFLSVLESIAPMQIRLVGFGQTSFHALPSEPEVGQTILLH